MINLKDLSRLIAASEDLTDHGMMNLQKLIEALVFAIVRVEARSYRREAEPAERIHEIDRIVHALPAKAIPQAFREVVAGATKRYTTDPKGDLPYVEAPDVFVCRSCGYIAVAEAPDLCSECGAATGVFRRFQGMFNGDNAEPEDPSMLIDLLDENARKLETLVSGLEEADFTRRPLAGRWSIRDHVTHFYDAQAILIQRVSLILTKDTPLLRTEVPYETATDSKGRPAETKEILRMFLDDRKGFTTRLRTLTLADLWRRGHHEDFGLVSVMHQVKYFAQHEQAHMGTVTQLRRAVAG
ncbi:MAG: DinB family protein [Spirochaetaceae bacterium]|nr:MAG: DinB family protein [Spirochaetaceae bacterium]